MLQENCRLFSYKLSQNCLNLIGLKQMTNLFSTIIAKYLKFVQDSIK